ncbi:MAG: hypothetical protein QOI36_3973 [Pseudonocardiales bacterium]|nr:hypothetical protein [Pseudonocardiales bacterium]
MATLPQPESDRIAGYLNFDMVASPNFVRFVYDGDNSDAVGAGPGPAGPAATPRQGRRAHGQAVAGRPRTRRLRS